MAPIEHSDYDDQQDTFEDASEELVVVSPPIEANNPKDNEEERELEASLQETTKLLRMALNNEFGKALEICQKTADRELYASLAAATLSFLRLALTMEQADLQAAVVAINRSFELSNSRRRKSSTASRMMRFIYRPNYDSYTDLEVHAELVHAESLLLLALISFLADQSIICLVKGALRIRACYQRYKECICIMESRKSWANQRTKNHFESGVHLGNGVFNLLMSYLPRRVLRFLEYVGFSGNRLVGVEALDKSVAMDDGLRSVFSTLVILTYHSYVENLFGLGSYDSEKVNQLNSLLAQNFPTSAFYLLFRGRYFQMEGRLEEAIETYEACIDAQDDWKQFHSICHWEMMWCYAVQLDWQRAAHYSDLLRKGSKWSVASYTYQYATFLYAKLVEDERNGVCPTDSDDYNKRMAEIRDVMEQVPKLRHRYAGKTLPAEKFAITRSVMFCNQNNRLSLPALEFLYIWNIFVTLKNSPRQVEMLLNRIDEEIDHINKLRLEKTEASESDCLAESGSSSSESEERNSLDDRNEDQCNWTDDLCVAYLLKGMCLKHLQRLDEAENCFRQVIESESELKVDTFLVPHCSMELAILKLIRHQYDESRQWIKRTRTQYTGYLLETIVHFRLHAASRIIRLEQRELCLTESSDSSSSIQQVKGTLSAGIVAS